MADSGANRPHVSHDDLAAGGAEGAGAQQAAASPSQAGASCPGALGTLQCRLILRDARNGSD
jgi:hypothetical protein